MIKNSNFGIYIHVPFCRRKCNYCDFYLVTNTNIIDNFVTTLINEIKMYAAEYTDITVDSIFYGGGTPSLLSDRQIYEIQNLLYKSFRIAGICEITMEANPEDFISSPERFASLRSSNINRISFGVQSFNNDTLKFLTRLHTSEDAEKVLVNAKKYFDNISIDMIYAVPSETGNDLTKSFQTALSLDIPHISAYGLIFEKYTKLNMLFEQNKINKKNTDDESEEYFIINNILSDAGYRQYEVSNYSRKGFESVHNRKYWKYDNYIGLGPSAHSSVDGERWNNFRSIIKYNRAVCSGAKPFDKKYKLSKKEIFEEFIFLGLRSEGIDIDRYSRLFNDNFEKRYESQIAEITEQGFGYISEEKFILNTKGKILADEIQLKYFSDINPAQE